MELKHLLRSDKETFLDVKNWDKLGENVAKFWANFELKDVELIGTLLIILIQTHMYNIRYTGCWE